MTHQGRLFGERPLSLALIGAGSMGRHWARTIALSPEATLVVVVDVDRDQAERLVREEGLGTVACARTLGEAERIASIDAVVNVTFPAAHLEVSTDALRRGMHVLTEKPIATTVAEAMQLAATSEATDRLLMTSQSRRYLTNLLEFRRQVASLGDIGTTTASFFRGPRFGGFRDEMEHPLLSDMAIHPFDVARFLLADDPVSVWCREWNPGWSWYRGAANAVAVFEMSGGSALVYTGSWCADGAETSWNGEWRVSGENGTATWDGEDEPIVRYGDGRARVETVASRNWGEMIEGTLNEFLHALRTGITPTGEVHDNILSLAMVEAAIASATTGRVVRLRDILDVAREAALREPLPEDEMLRLRGLRVGR